MLTTALIIASIVLLVITPLISVYRYYRPAQFSGLMNLGLIALTIVTWPFVPLWVAVRKRDTLLISMFWVSLLVWIVSLAYWLVLNVDQFMELQDKFRN